VKKLELLVEKAPVVGNQWIAIAHIVVGFHSQDENGRILLSPECRTSVEVRTWADDLIEQLEGIKQRADRIQWDNHPNYPENRRRR